MGEQQTSGYTILKTYVKDMKLNNRYEPSLDIACSAKVEFTNDIILEQSKNLTLKIIKDMNEELLQIFCDCDISIIEFLMSSRDNQFGIEIKIPDMAKIKYPREVQSLVNSIKQQMIYYFEENKNNNPQPPSFITPDPGNLQH